MLLQHCSISYRLAANSSDSWLRWILITRHTRNNLKDLNAELQLMSFIRCLTHKCFVWQRHAIPMNLLVELAVFLLPFIKSDLFYKPCLMFKIELVGKFNRQQSLLHLTAKGFTEPLNNPTIIPNLHKYIYIMKFENSSSIQYLPFSVFAEVALLSLYHSMINKQAQILSLMRAKLL